jgi:hypothetical protein
MAGRHREEGSAHAAEDQVGRGRQTCADVLAAGLGTSAQGHPGRQARSTGRLKVIARKAKSSGWLRKGIPLSPSCPLSEPMVAKWSEVS